MPRRFFMTGPLVVGPRRLEGAEAHHLTHVLRIGVGECVTLFDGSGIDALAELTAIADGTAEVVVRETYAARTEPSVCVVLATAVPKGERFGWLIEKATELGVQRFVPLITERSVILPGEGKLEKMRRTIVEASKQCGRSRMMDLAVPVRWAEFVARDVSASATWVAHPAGAPFESTRHVTTGPVVAAVGPEGGFTDAELELAVQAGARLVSLGARVLRIETAAVALAALWTCTACEQCE